MHNPAVYAKAIIAALVAGAGAGATAAQSDGISSAEWWFIAFTALTALGTVYGAPNKDPNAEAQEQSVQPAEPDAIYRQTTGEDDGPGVR